MGIVGFLMSTVTFVCDACGTENSVESDDYDTWSEGDEGSMGPKVEHWTEIETTCSECGAEISITLNQTEYPIGNFEDVEVSSSEGASNIVID